MTSVFCLYKDKVLSLKRITVTVLRKGNWFGFGGQAYLLRRRTDVLVLEEGQMLWF